MNELLSILTELRPECDFTRSSDFINEGLLDSLDIVTLVAELEDRLGIWIDGQDVTPEYFRNLDTLVALLRRYGAL
jgi:acyl carrier protein